MGAIAGYEMAQWDKSEVVTGDSCIEAQKVEKILVSVRLRPLSEKEAASGDPAEWECINDTTIMFRGGFPDRPMAPTAYSFDRVFRSDCSTREVYETAAREVALSVINGVNSSIFAYGQTSSGKTYTMTGITEYTVADVYEYISKHQERAFVLKFSAIEIYNEVVRDLLSIDNTALRLLDDSERGTYVEKLTEEVLRDWSHLKKLIAICEAQRKTGETYLNENSSRSHQILRLTIESSAREFMGKDNSTKLVASVNFVDLAGSERASQALSAGSRLKEGCHINRSLLTLGSVIRKLSGGRNVHVPYRDSKLTRILQPSLGGNARTAIICTVSPARSHIEQSRNTLLFASCAKEVVTNARVNVVMSNKALVKHLQQEVARLESKLRCPSSHSHLEALLKEKDAQIRKMEKEMKELKLERDLAQSRLDDLLHTVGSDDRATKRQGNLLDDEQSATVSSCIIDCDQSYDSRRDSGVRLPRSRMHAAATPSFSDNNRPWNADDDTEEICKEVMCVETEETSQMGSGESSAERSDLLDTGRDAQTLGDDELRSSVNSRPQSLDAVTLEQHLQNVRKPFLGLFKASEEGKSKRFSDPGSAGSRNSALSRSRSCRTVMVNSRRSNGSEHDDSTPPTDSLLSFPGRPQGLQRRTSALKYDDAESETNSRKGSVVSELGTTKDALDTQAISEAGDVDFTRIDDFVSELKEMAQYASDHYGILQSPARWLPEFEKKRREIMELWDACNVSLLHRTYFFLLFKGDPADAIYMEVELRRLSFVKNACSQAAAAADRKAEIGSLSTSLVLSAKKLRREREMLCRQMQRQLSSDERDRLYAKWGIAVESKRRKMQLAQRLWTETGDLEHARESASLVARLIGLLEPGQVLREMFGLSFALQGPNRRSHSSWRHGIAASLP